jgi:hypothetical protein
VYLLPLYTFARVVRCLRYFEYSTTALVRTCGRMLRAMCFPALHLNIMPSRDEPLTLLNSPLCLPSLIPLRRLGKNNIGVAGAAAIGEALKFNKKLTSLQ